MVERVSMCLLLPSDMTVLEETPVHVGFLSLLGAINQFNQWMSTSAPSTLSQPQIWSTSTLLRTFNFHQTNKIVYRVNVYQHNNLPMALNDSNVHIVTYMVNDQQDIYMGSTQEFSLQSWLDCVADAGNKGALVHINNAITMEGAFSLIKEMLPKLRKQLPMLWVGGDILPLTDRCKSRIRSELFVPLALEYLHNVPLSLGWNFDEHDALSNKKGHTNEEITKQSTLQALQHMHESWWRAVRTMYSICIPLIRDSPHREITFAIEACQAIYGLHQLTWLVEQQPAIFSVTVYKEIKNPCPIPMDVDLTSHLRNLQDNLPNGRLYLCGEGFEALRGQKSHKNIAPQ